VNYLHEAMNYLHDAVNYLHDAVYYFTGDRCAWNSLHVTDLHGIHLHGINLHNDDFTIVMERLQCTWIPMRWCTMLT
jgi:hypothetical protein